jgi:hypothetical protein
MTPVEQHHNHEHQRCIKHVQEYLMAQQIPRITLQILNNPEKTPDHDQPARNIQDIEVAPPRHIVEDSAGRSGRRAPFASGADALLERFVVHEAIVEHASDGNEDGEEGKLRKQAGDDEFLARVHGFYRAAGLDATTCRE